MNPHSPKYKENGVVYYPDTCNTLAAAWKAGSVQLHALARNNYPGMPIGDDSLSGINTIGYWSSQSQQGWGLDWHRNEGLEITFLETGSMPFTLETGEYMMSPNDLTITRPWQLHKVGNPSIGVGKLHWLIIDVNIRQPHQEWKWPSWIILSKSDLFELTKILRQNEQPVFSVNADIKRCFQKIGALVHDANHKNVESWIMIYVNELLVLLFEMLKNGAFTLNESLTGSVRTVELFIKELQSSFSEPWTVESMATHTRLGITQFTHYFKQLTNSTPMQYLNAIRLDLAAKEILSNPKPSIANICYDCGFNSTQYFSTLFAKRFGCTPSSYKDYKTNDR